jgi:L-cysteate sulfo-lyase
MTHLQELRSRIEAWPRLKLGSYPTPLEPLPNLTKQLAGPQLWIKRDDAIGPGMGGNKARKLEFLMAEVVERGKEKVVTYGGLQSNHARMTAAACAQFGFEAHLFYFDRRPREFQGNLLLNQLLGARMHFIPFGGGNNGSLTIETSNRLVRILATFHVGPGAYFIPVGGHNVLGCLGYVNAALEILDQLTALHLTNRTVTVITAAGTGGTLAGLMAGFGLAGSHVKVLGIDIGKLWRAFPASIARLAGDLCTALGEPRKYQPAETPVIVNRYVGPGYARISDETTIAIEMLAQSEGIILDPVYTGKAFAGMIDLVREGRFASDEHVVFLHTGGYPALWAEDEVVAA